MTWDATARRRWLGALALLTAMAMLVGGQTVLQGRLRGLVFVGYWLGCFGFTGLAMIVALLDARALQRRILEEQRELVKSALKDIKEETGIEARGPDRPSK